MSTHWDLTSLYTSFEDPKMEQDLASVKQEVKTLKKWFEENIDNKRLNDADKIIHIIKEITAIRFKADRYESFARLQSATDTMNQVTQEKLNMIEL